MTRTGNDNGEIKIKIPVSGDRFTRRAIKYKIGGSGIADKKDIELWARRIIRRAVADVIDDYNEHVDRELGTPERRPAQHPTNWMVSDGK